VKINNDNNNYDNNNNSNNNNPLAVISAKDNLFDCICISNKQINNVAFKRMCSRIFNFGSVNQEKSISTLKFNSIIASHNRKDISKYKKDIASRKKELFFKNLKEEIVNVIADSGAYANKICLIFKIGRSFNKLKIEENINYSFDSNNITEDCIQQTSPETPHLIKNYSN
jgi:hypothetical protein